MTTEIAIMNKSAVALAADSAVTITVTGPQGSNCKVLNSANKLFALSKCAPVGLMIYGNGSMLGVPWETIVKMYRARLGNREFSNLAGYCKHFFQFLDDFEITSEVEKSYVLRGAMSLFYDLKARLDEWCAEQLKAHGQLTSDQVEARLEPV